MNKSNQTPFSWRTQEKQINCAEIENPFTTIGLINAIIQDLNDIRRKIESIENYIIFQDNGNIFFYKD